MTAGRLRLACAIGLVSMAALAYQLLLMRWLAIAHWHSFAVVIISLALLGHGASGTVLSVLGHRAVRRFEMLFPASAIAFAVAAAACLPLARAIPFNGLELVWDLRQVGWLALLYLCLSLPFFFAAGCFGLAFARHGDGIPALYGADLLGAGMGAVVALLLSWLWPVDGALAVAIALAPLAALLVRPGWTVRVGAVAALALVAVLFARGGLAPETNPYKGLPRALLARDARVVAERHGPQGWVAVLESPRVPLRIVPGLSLQNTLEPASQLGVFVDGDGPGTITAHGDPSSLAYLTHTVSALPYALRRQPRVLVLGAGAGSDVLQARVLGARTVDAVERDANIVALARDSFGAFAGDLYHAPGVTVHVADARGFVRADDGRYDIMVLASGGTMAAGSAGVQAVAEDYAQTVEAFGDALGRLAPGGLLVATRWEKQPPRDALRLFATAVAALREAGIDDPGSHLLAIRNWDAGTLLVGREPLAPADVARALAFAGREGFDIVHAPGVRAEATGTFHFAGGDQREGARALLSNDAAAYIDAYKFDIAPVRDDRPYFGNFFKWSTLPELWRLRGQGAAVLLDSGYLLLLAALAQALPLAIALVLLPLLALPRGDAHGVSRWRAATYFLCLGLAFLFIEIACLGRLGLLVGHPILAIATGLAGFLAFAGLGSLCAQRWHERTRVAGRPVAWAVAGIAVALVWHVGTFALALSIGGAWPAWLRAVAGLATIAPLAFAMGMPFPLALARLAREAPAFVPWAWGINGCASVVAAIGALLLAIEVGLRATLAIALALYVLAAWAWREGRARAQ
ncbi:hypothetical protein GCM10028862_20790 [Luteimonas pelagia]